MKTIELGKLLKNISYKKATANYIEYMLFCRENPELDSPHARALQKRDEAQSKADGWDEIHEMEERDKSDQQKIMEIQIDSMERRFQNWWSGVDTYDLKWKYHKISGFVYDSRLIKNLNLQEPPQ